MTAHLLIHEGWQAELAWLGDRESPPAKDRRPNPELCHKVRRSSDCSHWCDDVARSAGDTLEVLLSDIVRTQFVAKATVVKATVVGVDDANDITTSAVDR